MIVDTERVVRVPSDSRTLFIPEQNHRTPILMRSPPPLCSMPDVDRRAQHDE